MDADQASIGQWNPNADLNEAEHVGVNSAQQCFQNLFANCKANVDVCFTSKRCGIRSASIVVIQHRLPRMIGVPR